MSKTKKTRISVESPNGDAFDFDITRVAYNSYQDAMTGPQKIKGMFNFLSQSATVECRPTLIDFIDTHPGSEVVLMSVINAEYAPDVEFEIKKS